MPDQPQGWTIDAGAGGVLVAVAPAQVGAGGVSDISSDRGGAFLGGGGVLGATSAGAAAGASGSRLIGPFGQDASAGLGQSFATRDATTVFSGDASLRYTFGEGGQSADWQGIATNDPTKAGFCMPLRPAASYRITIATRVSSIAGAPRYRIRLAHNQAETLVSSVDVAYAAAGVWETREFAFNVPAGAEPNSKLWVEFQRGGTTATDFWVDSIRAEENAIVSTSGGQVQTDSVANAAITKLKTEPRSRCSVFHSSNASITDVTLTTLNWDSENFDVGSLHDTVTNNTRITVPSGGDVGLWLLVAQVRWIGVTSGNQGARYVNIKKNGSSIVAENFISAVPVTGAGNASVQTVTALQGGLSVGDYFEVQVYHDTGGASPSRSVQSGSWLSFFSAHHIW